MPGCDDAEIHEEGDMIKFVGDRTAICQAKTDNCVMHCNERDSGKYMRTFKIPAGGESSIKLCLGSFYITPSVIVHSGYGTCIC